MFFVVFLLKKSTLCKNSILYQGGRYRTYTELGLGSLPWLEPLSYKKTCIRVKFKESRLPGLPVQRWLINAMKNPLVRLTTYRLLTRSFFDDLLLRK